MNEKTIRNHYQVRAALESMACLLCCRNGADLSAVENSLISARNALAGNDSSSYSNYNQSFHYEIWKASDNEKLINMLSELWNGLSMGLKTTEAEYAKVSQEEHERIFAAMAAGDGEKAGREMFCHIERSMKDVLTRYQE